MSLLYKQLESITPADLESLKTDQVGESQYLEYKTEVFDKRDEKKRLQFLGSLSGFANANGGDILVGVKATDGLPVDFPGLSASEVDSEILRISQLVGTSIQPQLTIRFHPVRFPTGNIVLVIRIPQSWTGPYAIEHNGHLHFYLRNAAGRSPMRVSELRTAFTLSGRVIDETRKFVNDRLRTLSSLNGPWPYFEKPLAVLHLVPFASVTEAVNLDISDLRDHHCLSPLAAAKDGYIERGDLRYNLDGIVMRKAAVRHSQLFRHGQVEYATTNFLNDHCLDAWHMQVNLVNVVSRFVALLKSLRVSPPITVQLSLFNVSNFYLRRSAGWLGDILSEHQIDRDQVMLPEVVMNDLDQNPIVVLKPIFDGLWNSAGLEKCEFYKQDGSSIIEPSWLDPANIR